MHSHTRKHSKCITYILYLRVSVVIFGVQALDKKKKLQEAKKYEIKSRARINKITKHAVYKTTTAKAVAESIYSRLKTTETRLMCALRCSCAQFCKGNMYRERKKNVYRTENGVVWTAAVAAKSIINSNKDLCGLERRSGFFLSFSF